jgi:hypothetical protein
MDGPGAELQDRWGDYRRVKTILLVLVCGWVPFGVAIGYILPRLSGSYNATYIAAGLYGAALMVFWLRYVFYGCPSCGVSLRGSQLFRRKCPRCGEPINRERSV